MSRAGRNKQTAFRIVVSDSIHARDGRRTEQVGHYNPLADPPTIEVNEERALHWLRAGARPTHTVVSLFRRAGLWKRWADERAGKGPASAGAVPSGESSSGDSPPEG